MKELMGAILSQNQRRRQGGGPRGPGHLNWNATNDKNLTKKPYFFIFISFSIFAYNSTRVQQQLTINNINGQGARRTPLNQFFQPI